MKPMNIPKFFRGIERAARFCRNVDGAALQLQGSRWVSGIRLAIPADVNLAKSGLRTVTE